MLVQYQLGRNVWITIPTLIIKPNKTIRTKRIYIWHEKKIAGSWHWFLHTCSKYQRWSCIWTHQANRQWSKWMLLYSSLRVQVQVINAQKAQYMHILKFLQRNWSYILSLCLFNKNLYEQLFQFGWWEVWEWEFTSKECIWSRTGKSC